ncbi:MAG: peptide-methionine (S)-S-oxide reductase [Rhizobiales bacterium 65-79]|jgi:peptide-methionine (S)-S-oxide reductase|nr:peptide-methionine (S)-S-oxide reductase MsrA [Hyphomicrobiales bacterium]OJU00133.1 MAG: peptide-methionine (S)-S-oxide reductase [Rhizobiales bacterium 65-79]
MTKPNSSASIRRIFTGRSLALLSAGIAALCYAGLQLAPSSAGAEETHVVPAPAMDEPAHGGLETAVLAGGCFWGVQGVFQHVVGVASATSGYTGGAADTAHYDMVSTGETGHAESVRIVFDPKTVSYGHLLQIFFSVAHDPTELNRQGPDTGTQYRSAIFPTSAEQAKVAKAYIAQLSGAHAYSSSIVTTIEPGKKFYPAEGYHQNFLTDHPEYPYIVINDLPKIASLKELFPAEYSPKPVLVASSGD